jgi:hypothetical protein
VGVAFGISESTAPETPFEYKKPTDPIHRKKTIAPMRIPGVLAGLLSFIIQESVRQMKFF